MHRQTLLSQIRHQITQRLIRVSIECLGHGPQNMRPQRDRSVTDFLCNLPATSATFATFLHYLYDQSPINRRPIVVRSAIILHIVCDRWATDRRLVQSNRRSISDRSAILGDCLELNSDWVRDWL